ncbi:MAG TPA: hypothetical protein VGL78_18880 [Solirubrobacteraceae bacterium]|jgi:hypothetical protein
MTDGYFDALERELRAAVPRAASLASPQRRWRRSVSNAVVPAFGLAVALAVAVAGVVLLGHAHRTAGSPPAESPSACAGAGSVSNLCQLRANFAVLRRAQTAADRSWHPHLPVNAGVLPQLTRLAAVLPGPQRIFLSVERFRNAPGGEPPAGSYSLDIDIVSPGRDTSANFGPNVNYTVFPLASPGLQTGSRTAPIWASIIPDGVVRVRWTFACPPGDAAHCSSRQPITITKPVRNNVAAATVPGTAEGCGPAPGACAAPATVTWYGTGGQVVAAFSRSNKQNLTRPPFIKHNPTAPLPSTLPAVRSAHEQHVRVQVAHAGRYCTTPQGEALMRCSKRVQNLIRLGGRSQQWLVIFTFSAPKPTTANGRSYYYYTVEAQPGCPNQSQFGADRGQVRKRQQVLLWAAFDKLCPGSGHGAISLITLPPAGGRGAGFTPGQGRALQIANFNFVIPTGR